GNYIQLLNNATAVNATTASFDGKTGASATVAQNMAIEDKIVHKLDNASAGLVRVKAGELFVTANSGSIQRAVDNSASSDTVYAQAGTYGESVTINSAITVIGAQQGVAGWESARGSSETVIQGKLTVTTNATVDGVMLTKPSTATNTGTGMNFTGWDGINVVATNGAVIRNSVVEAYGAHGGFGGSGFVSLGAGGATFESNKVSAGAGYTAASDDRGVASVEVKGSGTHVIRGNQLLVSTNNADAVNIFNGTATVDNNQISGVDGGIVAYAGFTGVTITNNTVSNYNDNGIRVFNHTGTAAATVDIRGNTVTGVNPLLVDTNTNLQYVIGSEAAAPVTTTSQLLAMLSGNSGISQMKAAYFVSWAPQSFSIDGVSVTGAYVGTASDDTISASTGTNILIAGAGNDTMSGGSATDVVSFSGNYSGYTLGYSGNTVTVSGPDGNDSVTSVETLQFADKRVHVVGSAVGSANTTINQGISAASTGDVVMVAAGTYAETLSISKAVTVLGAKQGVAGSASSRGSDETTIQGKVTITTNAVLDGVTVTKPSTSTNTGSNINFTGWDGVSVAASNGAV
ncbi:MAG: beta strand repeat-containing protein, partial [Bacteroidota bacterium]